MRRRGDTRHGFPTDTDERLANKRNVDLGITIRAAANACTNLSRSNSGSP